MPVLILIQPMRKLNDSNDYYVKCVWEEWVWNLAVISLNLLVTESMIPSQLTMHAACDYSLTSHFAESAMYYDVIWCSCAIGVSVSVCDHYADRENTRQEHAYMYLPHQHLVFVLAHE